jgi:citrate lyase subunit beta/citryl-CoA lyase
MLKPTMAHGAAKMPFRFWGQHAHLIVPANRAELIRKAIRQGTAPTGRLMAAAGATAADLAEALGLDEPVVRALLDNPRRAPVVVIDGEDGLPAGRAAGQSIDDVVKALATERSLQVAGPLIVYRMPAVAAGGLDNLREVLRLISGNDDVAKLDGVVIPKVEAADEVEAVAGVIAETERVGNLSRGQLRVMVQIESAAGLAALPTIVRLPEARLASLIFGAADFAADLGLPSTDLDQPIIRHARFEIVEAGAIARVPAIDGMTLAYPVLDLTLAAAANRLRWLDRMALAYADAKSAFAVGMTGKWVGHPAQLFAVTLARAAILPVDLLEGAVGQIAGYRDALEHDRGVTVVDGKMADRATARHAREILRRATAFGLFDSRRALELGVVSEQELAQ